MRPEDDVAQRLYGPVWHARRGDDQQADHGDVVVLYGGEQRLELEVRVGVAVGAAAGRRRRDVVRRRRTGAVADQQARHVQLVAVGGQEQRRYPGQRQLPTDTPHGKKVKFSHTRWARS